MSRNKSTSRIKENTFRIPKQLYWKLQDLAYIHGKSLNETVVLALGSHIRNYEAEWGYLEHSPDTVADIVKEAQRSDPEILAQVIADSEKGESSSRKPSSE